jgi:transposase
MENPTSIELYSKMLEIPKPWEVVKVEQNPANKAIVISIEYKAPGDEIVCPVCGRPGKIHDHRIRRLRHLDTCDYQTILEVSVPRIKCEEHKVQQMPVDFAEKSSRYTVVFESAVTQRLRCNTIKAACEGFHLSWDAIDGIMQRAINRGLRRRKKRKVWNIGIDETSNQRRHDYVTVILDKDRASVIDVLTDRKAQTLGEWFSEQKICNFKDLQSISMDMWDPYIKAVMDSVEDAQEKICFDRFHVAKYFTQAVDKVRRREHRDFLRLAGESPLSKTRFDWLVNSERKDNRSSRRRAFLSLSRLKLETSRAWRIKETASTLWDYLYMNVAEKAWKKLLGWISHCRIEEMIQVGETVRNYFWGILNAVRLKATNGMVEAKNYCIQRIKNMACGFRNKERFRRAILFHFGNLDMRPSTI